MCSRMIHILLNINYFFEKNKNHDTTFLLNNYEGGRYE